MRYSTLIFTLITFFTFSFFTYSQTNQESYSKCKIFTNDEGLIQLNQLGIAVDHGIRKKNTFFISDFSAKEIQLMTQNGFQVEILIEDVVTFYKNQEREIGIIRNASCSTNQTYHAPEVPSHFSLGSMAGFFTYEEYLSHIDLMASLYPDLITVKAPIGSFQSIEGRPIYYVKISDQANQDETEPEVLYTAIHHAREPNSLSSTIFYMWYLLENYATNEEIKYLVDETEMFFVPVVNPDGYIYNQTIEPNGGGLWRKNRKDNLDGNFGVDLNRNYSHGWGTTGISFDPSSETFPGTGAFSEPETQAMKWFCEQRDFLYAFNAHTYSNLILFPIGTEINVFAEDHDYFQSISSHMVQYNSFIAEKSSNLYPASGDSDDYMYAEDLTIKPKIFAFTPEIGTQEDGFWPVSDRIIPLCQDMVFSNLVLAFATHNYWSVKEVDAQVITETSGVFTHEVNRLGLDNSPLIVSIEPLSGIESVGSQLSYTLNLNENSTGTISYTLSPSILFGQEIKYVLVSNFGPIQKRDTIVKTFGNPTLQSIDNASTIENWLGDWNTTTEDFVSPSTSITDSPNDTYNNDTSKIMTYIPTINLTNATAAKVEFYAKWQIEENFDYVAFEVSTDSINWVPQCGKFTNIGTNADGSVQPQGLPIYEGEQNTWVLEEISLNDYLGQNIHVRFILKSDGGVTDDGFYFDDFKIYYNVTNSLNELVSNQLLIYPNPAKDKISIAFPQVMNNVKYVLKDLQGKTLISGDKIGMMNSLTLSLDQLSNGSYYLEIIDENKVKYVNKLIVLR
jgi:carboxypeptidase T